MANEKQVNYIVEFDGTGSPTGTAWVDGHRFTFTATSLSLRVPPTTGKSTDKFTVYFQALISGQLGETPTSVTAISPITSDGKKHSSVNHTHA